MIVQLRVNTVMHLGLYSRQLNLETINAKVVVVRTKNVNAIVRVAKWIHIRAFNIHTKGITCIAFTAKVIYQ